MLADPAVADPAVADPAVADPAVADPLADRLADPLADASRLPPVDSINMWPLLSGDTSTSPRVELPLSAGKEVGMAGTGLIVACPAWHACPKVLPVARAASASTVTGRLYKLVRGWQPNALFPGPTTPNGTARCVPCTVPHHPPPHPPNASHPSPCCPGIDCAAGCLFELHSDPTEHTDLARALPQLLRAMQARAAAIDETVYQTPGGIDADPRARQAAVSRYGGFWGPWQSDEDVHGMKGSVSWRVGECDDCV